MKFERLVVKGIVTREKLAGIMEESISAGSRPEELLVESGVAKHEILLCLSEHYELPYLEYDEGLLVAETVLRPLDLERLKQALWFPLAVHGEKAWVVVCNFRDPALTEEIKRTLRVEEIDWLLALPSDLIRIIENNQDVNPHFPPSAGRTPLARLRTFLADRRTAMAGDRTALAKGRTGLAFIRTGMSFMAIALVMFRIFGIGYLAIFEVILLFAGMVMVTDGFLWYLPARRVGKRRPSYTATEHTFGTTVLELADPGESPVFTRTAPIRGAEELRAGWNRLSTVMKRRFLAIDRTDLAEERTILGHYRTIMARARTGLAFTRTGIAFIGLGIALLRQFPAGRWTVFDGALILWGVAMTMEGLHWYIPGRRAGKAGLQAIQRTERGHSIWDFMFRPFQKRLSIDDLPPTLSIKESHEPGIWGTTGLALERTLIADRRNVKARLRTIMARSRTGMAFIRTGTAIFSVGLGLLVYFGTSSAAWAVFDLILMLIGLVLIGDGFYWHIPAERTKEQFPYCFADMEIVIPDYARPAAYWQKVIFSHDDL